MNKLPKIYILIFLLLSLFAGKGLAQTSSTITFSTPLFYMPFVSYDANSKAYGFTPSFITLLCKEMQVECLFKPEIFANVFNTVENKQVDAGVGAIAITPMRAERFNFTIPYLVGTGSLLGNKKFGEELAQATLFDITNGKSIGVVNGTVFHMHVKKHFPQAYPVIYPTNQAMLDELANGKIDFILIDTPAANFWLNQAPRHFYLASAPLKVNGLFAIIVNKDNPELLAKLNQAISNVTVSTEYLQLLETFFPTNIL